MCNHNSMFGQGEDVYFTDGWDCLFHSFGQCDLLADGMEITASFLFQWRSRWTFHEASDSLLIKRITITLYVWKVVFIAVLEAKTSRARQTLRWWRIYRHYGKREKRFGKLINGLDFNKKKNECFI